MSSRIVEVNNEGTLSLPADVLEQAPPHTQYRVDVHGNIIVLTPLDGPAPLWATANPEERAKDLVQWAASHADGPGLPDEALRREHLYE